MTMTKLEVAFKSAVRSLYPIGAALIVELWDAWQHGRLNGLRAFVAIVIGMLVKFIGTYATAKSVEIKRQ